ncbi:MAG: prolyl oligopeptidase family serine peptidase [Paracoccaceae bacterium]|jgi:dipeptidyl aminopeptidase/acylaminoacyl peptidase|nr:prolyl oligopeptidase family serine peptidase [Paracoccaceae bacterium]
MGQDGETRETAAFGSWVSPISAEDIAAGTVSFEQLCLDGDDIYWIEGRPAEAGRSVVCRHRPGEGVSDVTPKGFSARTRVNSYGGGAMAVEGGCVWFANLAGKDFPDTGDQRLRRQRPGEIPQPVTPLRKVSYAEMVPDTERGCVYAVQEDADTLVRGQPEQSLVSLDMEGRLLPETIAAGGDFYAAPCLSPDGTQLAWITWDLPSMPWDGTRLQVADLSPDGIPTDIRTIGGAPARHVDPDLNPVFQDLLRFSDESILEPRFAPDGTLYVVSDRTEVDGDRWWNIHRVEGDDLVPVTRRAAEFTAPPWQLGGASWGFLSAGEILAAFTTGGTWRLARVDIASGRIDEIDTPYTAISHLKVGDGVAAFIGGRPGAPTAVVRFDAGTGACTEVRASTELTEAQAACLPVPEHITYPVGDPEAGAVSHAFFHPPSNPGYEGPEHAAPPVVIFIHGGPSGATTSALSLDIAYFTSRGMAVVDVNYRGSTGYGRAYRQALYGGWGVMDTNDCADAARHLIATHRVDRYGVAARGGSSGGFTTLALATFTDLLSAGTSRYGISDLGLIATHTHKFESQYAALLVGPWPAAQKVFKARSPLYHADEINCPLIILQGEDDPVVPPEQARVLIDAMMARKLPVAWEFFPGEGHGFRQKAHKIAALELETSFYGAIMGFTPAGNLARPEIRNWDGA